MKKIKDYDDNCPIDDTLKLISNRVLTDTLKFMEDNDLITKQVFENDIKTEYSLTQKGFNLNKILYNMLEYGLNEVNSGNLSEKQKEELLNETKRRIIK